MGHILALLLINVGDNHVMNSWIDKSILRTAAKNSQKTMHIISLLESLKRNRKESLLKLFKIQNKDDSRI